MTAEIQPLAPGMTVPDFTLTDLLSNVPFVLSEHFSQPVLLDFWSIECPWSQHYDAYFVEQAPRWQEAGITFWMIASNANETPDDIRTKAAELGIDWPVLHDPGNAVADALGAQITPHLYLISAEGVLLYNGAVDDRSFRQREATTNHLEAALEAVLAGREPDPAQTPAYGCTIVREWVED